MRAATVTIRLDAKLQREVDRLWMERAFAIDVLACPDCGGRLRLIALLHDPAVIRAILGHRSRAPSNESPGPAPPGPGAAAC